MVGGRPTTRLTDDVRGTSSGRSKILPDRRLLVEVQVYLKSWDLSSEVASSICVTHSTIHPFLCLYLVRGSRNEPTTKPKNKKRKRSSHTLSDVTHLEKGFYFLIVRREYGVRRHGIVSGFFHNASGDKSED